MWRWLLAMVSIPAGLVVAFILDWKLVSLLAGSIPVGIATGLMTGLGVLATIVPPALLVPRQKLLVACALFTADAIFLLWSLPAIPAASTYVDLAISLVVGVCCLGLVGYVYGRHDRGRGWPPLLARLGRSRTVRRTGYALLLGCVTSEVVKAISYRDWGFDPNEQFQRGFPFREIYGAKFAVGFNIDYLGAWLNLLFWMALWFMMFYLVGAAWQRWRQRARHE